MKIVVSFGLYKDYILDDIGIKNVCWVNVLTEAIQV